MEILNTLFPVRVEHWRAAYADDFSTPMDNAAFQTAFKSGLVISLDRRNYFP